MIELVRFRAAAGGVSVTYGEEETEVITSGDEETESVTSGGGKSRVIYIRVGFKTEAASQRRTKTKVEFLFSTQKVKSHPKSSLTTLNIQNTLILGQQTRGG